MSGNLDRTDGLRGWGIRSKSDVVGKDSWGVLHTGRTSHSEPNGKQVRTDSNANGLDLALGMNRDTHFLAVFLLALPISPLSHLPHFQHSD